MILINATTLERINPGMMIALRDERGIVVKEGKLDSVSCPMVYVAWKGDKHVSAIEAKRLGLRFYHKAKRGRAAYVT